MSKTLWYKSKTGLSARGVNRVIDSFNESFSVDKRLVAEDIQGSIAYVSALKKAGILSSKEAKQVQKGLILLKQKLPLSGDYEDIHTAIESMLVKKIGRSALKIHTGRSRNEQVVSAERLYLKKEIPKIQAGIKELQKTLTMAASKYLSVIMPGYTHLQQAQPVLFSYYLMSWFFMMERDKNRLTDCLIRLDVCPYGSGALAGNPYKIDRAEIAKQLGFSSVSENALDAVSDRDFIVEFLSVCAIAMMHLSRFSEDMIIWSSSEFGFIRLARGLATSSSLMPQKHNPDTLELIRGKTGRVYGNLVNILTVMKGLPSGYNKDMQEDKSALFDTLDTLKESLQVFTLAIKTMTIFPERMKQAINNFTLGTDMADYLVRKAVPFRQSHHIVSGLVRYAIKQGKSLSSLRLDEFKRFSPLFDKNLYKVFDLTRAVESRNTYGGTSTAMVKKQIKLAKRIC
jgi:argininosuccinate lyase